MSQPFVVLEGLTGSGKSTVAAQIARRWGLEQTPVVPEEFAGALRLVEDDLSMLETRYALFVASALHCARKVEQLVTQGVGVVLDSWIYRTMATHSALGSQSEWVVPSWVPEPTLSIFLDVSEEIRQLRIARRGRPSGYWKAQCELHSADILDEYRRVAPNMVWVDASGDISEVVARVEDVGRGLF